jgi:hypothetical protein
MEPHDSSPCSQEPSTGPYPDPFEFSPHLHTLLLFTTLFNITLPSIPSLASFLFSLGFPSKILWTFMIFPLCVTRPSYRILVDLINETISGKTNK